jgi:putative ABC transport system substrate-binding protein
MRRRELILGLSGAAASFPFAAGGQQKTMPVIGYLSLAAPGPFAPLTAAFRRGLNDTGYIEGRNVTLEYRWADGHEDRLTALAADLVSRKVDVLTTFGGIRAVMAAKTATSTIPIVFEVGADPVAYGLVASIARPGGNLTGVSILTADLNPKRFALLSELIPRARAIAVLVNAGNAGAGRIVTDMQQAGRANRVLLHILSVVGTQEFDSAFASLAQLQADALLVANDPVFFGRRDELVALAARHAIPAMYEWREFAEIGGLISYGTSIAGMYREKGRYVGRVLAGAKPADMPIQQPTKFELVINLKTAKSLGLTVPESLLARADEVIE